MQTLRGRLPLIIQPYVTNLGNINVIWVSLLPCKQEFGWLLPFLRFLFILSVENKGQLRQRSGLLCSSFLLLFLFLCGFEVILKWPIEYNISHPAIKHIQIRGIMFILAQYFLQYIALHTFLEKSVIVYNIQWKTHSTVKQQFVFNFPLSNSKTLLNANYWQFFAGYNLVRIIKKSHYHVNNLVFLRGSYLILYQKKKLPFHPYS